MENNNEYLDELKANGVDLPELDNPDPQNQEPELTPEPETKDENPEDKGTEDGEEDDDEGEKPVKRSIYKSLKDKKLKLKDATAKLSDGEKLLEMKNQEIARLQDQLKSAQTVEEKQDAQDELDAFAEEVGLDPEGVQKLKSLILKDVPASRLSDEDKQAIESAKVISKKDEEKAEKERFDNEFQEFTPSLTKFFPNLSDADKEVVKSELNRLAHSEGYNDKELDYILFKNQDSISKLLSPRKRGLESKNNETVNSGEISNDFNPNPDFSKMTTKEIEKWETDYANIGNLGDGLATDSNGRKLII